jgi:hypothetical protein
MFRYFYFEISAEVRIARIVLLLHSFKATLGYNMCMILIAV